jgi:hypothetical protein
LCVTITHCLLTWADLAQLFWSILLLCLGRHPSQNPHHFTPDIGQVPRAVVDKLPLVLYIPPPPDQPSKPVTFPSDLHTYPPKSPRRRLRFLPFGRRGASPSQIIKSSTGKEKGNPNRPLTWEDHWEKGEYPFVQLDSHRASCAICLLDFEAPRRMGVGAQGSDNTNGVQTQTPREEAENHPISEPGAQQEGEADVTEQAAVLVLPGDDLTLRLQDAGQGAQPLRLLKCGHVFHVSPMLECGGCGADDLILLPSTRKRASIRGCSMYRAVVQYASDLFVSRWIQQAQNRMRARRAGDGSEEAGGEDPRDRWITINN